MTSQQAVRGLALGRIAFGTALLLAPRAAAAGWIGPEAQGGGATVLARALGARDAFMGLMTLHTVGRPDVGRRWASACAVIDAIDGAATAAGRRELPPVGAGVAMTVAFGSAAAHAALSQRV